QVHHERPGDHGRAVLELQHLPQPSERDGPSRRSIVATCGRRSVCARRPSRSRACPDTRDTTPRQYSRIPLHPPGRLHVTGFLHVAGLVHATGFLHVAGLVHATGFLHVAGLVHPTSFLHVAGLVHVTGFLHICWFHVGGSFLVPRCVGRRARIAPVIETSAPANCESARAALAITAHTRAGFHPRLSFHV